MNTPINGDLKDKKLIWRCRTKNCKGVTDKMGGLCEECKKRAKKPQSKPLF
jgi:hypothetical protein